MPTATARVTADATASRSRGTRRFYAAALAGLAGAAPVGRAVRIAETARAHGRAAPRARSSCAAVDGSRGAAAGNRGTHLLARPLERRGELVVRDLSERAPRARGARSTASPRATCSRSRRRAAGRAAPHREDARSPSAAGGRRRRATTVSSARRSGPSRSSGRRSSDSTGPFHCVASHSRPRRTSQGRPRRSRSGSVEPPPAVHPQVAAEHDASLEAQQQMLSHRLDALEHAPVHRLRDPGGRTTGMRALRGDPVSDDRLQARRGAVEGVALGHAGQAASADSSSRSALKIDSENVG